MGLGAREDGWALAERRAGRGRCAVAQIDLGPGAVVLREVAWTAVLRRSELRERCAFSFEQAEKLLRCPVTQLHFASKKEQRQAKEEFYGCELRASKALVDAGTGRSIRDLSPAVQLAARTLWRASAAGSDVQIPWVELEDHWFALSDSRRTELSQVAQLCCQVVHAGLPEGSAPPDVRSVARLLAAISVNAYPIMDEEQRETGLGLFLRASVFNHDEEPNCVHSFAGREMLVRTRRAVKAGEELTITYDDLAEASCFRRQRLQQQYFFDPAPAGASLPQSVLARDEAVTKVFAHSTGKRLAVEPGLAWNAELGVCAAEAQARGGGGLPAAEHSPEHAAAASWLRGLHVRWQKLSGEEDAKARLAGMAALWKSTCSGAAVGHGTRASFKLGVGHTLGLHVARAAMDAAVDAALWEEAASWARRVCASEAAIFGSTAEPWPVPASSLARLAKLELYLGCFAAARAAAQRALAIFGSLGVTGGSIVEEVRNIMGQAEAEDGCREQALKAPALECAEEAEEGGSAVVLPTARSLAPLSAASQDPEAAARKPAASSADSLDAMD